MATPYLFEDLDNAQSMGAERKPFFAVNHENDNELLEWLKQEIEYLKGEYSEWHDEVKNNYKRFKEIQYRSQVNFARDRDLPDRRTRYTPQVVAPLVRDLTDERIARMMEFKPNVVILPQHDEQQDKVDAKIAKKFVKHIDKSERVDYKLQKLLRTAYVAGEGYLTIEWNPDKGFLHPAAKEAGKVLFVGDVDIKHYSPLKFMMEKRDDDGERDYCFKFDIEYVDVLKKKYASKAGELDKLTATYYDAEKMEDVNERGKCVKVTFWHRKTPFMPDGYECCFVDGVVLKKGALPYQHGKLPVITLSDNENLEESHGRSFINSVKGMVTYFNNLLNMSIKQMTLLSYPKWMVDAGSVDLQQLNNDTGIVQVKPGAQKPTMHQGNPLSPQLMGFMDKALEWVYSWGKSNSVIRGEPPAGVTAFVALQYVSESENRRMNTSVVKFNEAIRLMYEQVLLTCGQYYKKEDQRTILVIGRDGNWQVEDYDPKSLAKPYSIVLQNASALPDSKSARTQYLIDMAKQFPDLFPREQLIEMLDLAQSDKFMDEGAMAARAAESENEMMMEGEEPPAPEAHEFLVTHWKIHVAAMQDLTFKTKASDVTRTLFRDHVLGTEFLMMEKARQNEGFFVELTKLPQWPIFLQVNLAELAPLPPMPPGGELPPPMPGEEMMPPMTEGMPIQPEDSMAGSPPPVADAANLVPDMELPQLQ